MSLLNFCFEVRTNLLCVNIHLQFDQALLDPNNIDFSIENDTLIIKEKNAVTRISFGKYFSLSDDTLGNLIIGETHASLRLSIDEIYNTNFNLSIEAANEALTAAPRMEINSEIGIICRKCECLLARNQKYQRIFEYPSGPVDLINFYCHDNPHYDLAIAPQLFDLFYGFRFFVVSADLIDSATFNKDGILYCKRCKQFIGEQVLSGRAGKLWTDYLLFKSFGIPHEIWHKTTVRLPYLLLHKIVSESVSSIYESFTFTKVLIESVYPNRKHKYLMMNLLEKNLDALRSAQHMKYSENPVSQSLDIQLISTKGFKVLYRLTTEVPPIEQQLEIVDQLIEYGGIAMDYITSKPRMVSGYAALCNPIEFCNVNMDIRCLKISPRLFNELLYELDYNATLLPEDQRHVANNFQMTYIFNSP